MTTPGDAQRYIGRTAVDAEGSKVGKIGQVYLDDASGEPLWVTVSTGLFGTRQSFAPVFGARLTGDDVTLAVSKDQIKDAPNVDDGAHISDDERGALYQHYSGYLGSQAPGQAEYADRALAAYADAGITLDPDPAPAGYAGSDLREGSGTSGDVSGDAMTRSEERLNVGPENVAAGWPRLRKYVVTEQQEVSGEVRKEQPDAPGADGPAAVG